MAFILIDQFFFNGTGSRLRRIHSGLSSCCRRSVRHERALLAALASTAALLIGNIPGPHQSTTFSSKLVADPVMWFIAAIALGELRMRHITERDRLQEDLSNSRKREDELTDAYGRLTSLKDSLEARVAGQMRTAINMYQAARSLERLDPSESFSVSRRSFTLS